jgi:hypothetical protein
VKGFSCDKLPGDDVACPVCRTDFTVPDKGVDDLPKNFFIQQLKDLTLTSGIRGQRHSVAETNKVSIKQAVMNCKEHSDRPVELYCFDCQSTICVECLVESHKSHQCSVVSKVVDEFRKQMTAEIKQMAETVEQCRDMLKVQEKHKTAFISEVDRIEKQICDHAEQLIKVISSTKYVLLQELETKKKEKVKQIQNVIEDIEQQTSFIGSLIKYAEELRDKGTAVDVAQQRKALRDRADELTKLNNRHREISDFHSIKIHFEAAKMPVNGGNSLVGQVHYEGKL